MTKRPALIIPAAVVGVLLLALAFAWFQRGGQPKRDRRAATR